MDEPINDWFNYSLEELTTREHQMEVFLKMLRRLENDGHCRDVFHRLAEVLFGDRLD